MATDLWRWADPDGQQRKVRLDELRAALADGLIAPNTPVWREGFQGWQPAHEVPELSSASLGGANGVVLNIPPPPLAMVAVQQEYEASSTSIAPMPPVGPPDAEPPPPPAYVPAPVKVVAGMKTQVSGTVTVGGDQPGPAPKPAAPGKMPASLPTAIGLPPPPEVLAAATVATKPRSQPPPPPPRGRPAASPPIEELSESMLEDRSSNEDLAPALGLQGEGGLPPPTDPVVHGTPSLSGEEALGLPRRPGLSLILDDIAAIRRGEQPKNKLLLGVLGALALAVVIMLIAGIASLASGGGSSDEDRKAMASASASAAPVPAASLSLAAATTTPPPVETTPTAPTTPDPPSAPVAKASGKTFGDCSTTGEAKVIAPRAVIASGIEAHALGGGLALGFAAAPREAVATSLDPSSLAPTATVRTKPTGGDARRVNPLFIGGKLTAMPDVERKGDRLVGRRSVSTTSLIDVGHADGAIVWAPHGRDSFAKLFTVDGEAQVEALRAVSLADRKGIALAFRKGNTIQIGTAKGDSVLEAEGSLSTINGLGQVGSPAVAASGDQVMAAWADRAGASDEWKIRIARFKVGGATDEAIAFTMPDGGLGGQAMSPTLASLGGGRFLLAWTEGPVSNHQVRAISVNADGTPSGSALSISASGVNAGQPAAVIGNDGRGAVAFLAAKGKALEVHATPISCPLNK